MSANECIQLLEVHASDLIRSNQRIIFDMLFTLKFLSDDKNWQFSQIEEINTYWCPGTHEVPEEVMRELHAELKAMDNRWKYNTDKYSLQPLCNKSDYHYLKDILTTLSCYQCKHWGYEEDSEGFYYTHDTGPLYAKNLIKALESID